VCWGHRRHQAPVLQVTAAALPASPLLFFHIRGAPDPGTHLRGSFAFFFVPAFVALRRKEKENVFAACISAVACLCGSGASFEPICQLSQFRWSRGTWSEPCLKELRAREVFQTRTMTSTGRLCSQYRPYPRARCTRGPVRVPHWEHQLPSAASRLPLLATAASAFAVKSADKRGGG